MENKSGRKREGKNRVDRIMILLEKEAGERLKSRKGRNMVSVLYEVQMEVERKVGDLMAKFRDNE